MSDGFKNITDYLYKTAFNNPDKRAFLHPENISYGKLCNLVDTYASGFQQSEIKKGTHTVVLIKPGVDLFAVTFALFRIGAIPVMIDPGMGTKAMVSALDKTKPEAFIGIPKALILKYLFPKAFGTVKIWISTGSNWVWKGKKLKTFRRKKPKKYDVANIERSDTVAIFFTSGSTGPAKGVVYKNYMLEAQLQLLRSHFKYNPKEIDLCTFPLIGLFSVCLGLSVVLADMDMTHPAKMNPDKVAKNINRFDCTYMFCSPMVLKKLADFCVKKNIKLQSLKKVMVAGAPVLPALLQKGDTIISDFAEIHTPYGATEALPVTDINHLELLKLYGKNKSFTEGICVGYCLEGINIKIIKISDSEIESWNDVKLCEVGEIGEIVVSGENVTQSYFENEEANRLSKIRDSSDRFFWHRTGDLGMLDDEERIWFYGRKSHRVETNGEILFTITTEAVFNQHPDVVRSALVGVNLNGENEAVVCIQLKSGIKKNKKMVYEFKKMALKYEHTKNISVFLFHHQFPVDPRHNAKIFREKLAKWAQKKIK